MRIAALVELGQFFVVREPRADESYYSGTVVLMKSVAHHSGYMNSNISYDTGQLNLPGKLRFRLRPGEHAVYVGTLRYHRDDYSAITKVELLDEYPKANHEFVKRFGVGMKLSKLVPQRVK